MNGAQIQKYFWEWGRLRKVLRERGLTSKQADARRSELTRKALGHDKSSKDFTNADLDAVLRVFAAERDPSGFDEQMKLQDSPDRAEASVRNRIEAAAAAIVTDGDPNFIGLHRNNYISSTARRITGKQYHECTHADRVKIMGALERSAAVKRRRAATQEAARLEAADKGNPF
jgi:hypothetical protein